MTASPLCRLRVGDLFTSNYSKESMARMMGINDVQFSYGGITRPDEDELQKSFLDEQASGIRNSGRVFGWVWNNFMRGNAHLLTEGKEYTRMKYKGEAMFKDDTSLGVVLDGQITEKDGYIGVVTVPAEMGDPALSLKYLKPVQPLAKFGITTYDQFLRLTHALINEDSSGGLVQAVFSGSGTEDAAGISDLFSNKNPIIKAFESTMGRGIAVAVTGISFDWKLNTQAWNLEVGSRAPRACEVQLSVTPIHDITPGLDHEGFNRAPIYKVGEMRNYSGDVWLSQGEFTELKDGINSENYKAMRGVTGEEK